MSVQEGHRIKIGDRACVATRLFWKEKIGVHIGRDTRTKKLKIRFEEFGGALLLCWASELRRMGLVGNENPVTMAEKESFRS